MGMGMGISFQYPMAMDMGVIFENSYECGYSSTHPESTSLPFLIKDKKFNVN